VRGRTAVRLGGAEALTFTDNFFAYF
jgi:hypothetical protein